MQSEQILFGSMSAALVVLSGAAYALLFALARIRSSQTLLCFAYGAYLALCLCALILTRALELETFWVAVVAVMLVGYWLAPIAIWHLCVGTHEAEPGAGLPDNHGSAR